MTKYKIGLISLGCDKNRIDSEIILGNLSGNNKIVNDPNKADIIIVNTCGFIESSKEESINTILEMAQYKKGKCKMLIATGCLTQRYSKELQESVPEIDIMLGVNDYAKMQEHIADFFNNEDQNIVECNYSDQVINEGNRILTTKSHVAYLRISEGCDNLCTYCIIPKIRGKYRSRRIENIVDEAKKLASIGVKEIILVGQDTSIYGTDIYAENKLHELIKELSKIEKIQWIRVMYLYPERITDEFINEMASNNKVCKYLDMPIQHISNSILKKMNRKSSKELIINNINKLRSKVKDITLRTSIIVGFPGESEEDFNELKKFIKEIKFDKLGVFKYSQEEDTPAAKMDNQIDENIKEFRFEELMITQQAVSREINKDKIGKTYKVIVEGLKKELYYGRSYEMAPEIDGEIMFKCDKILNIGDFTEVLITDASEYDLLGVVNYESCK